MKPDTLQIKPIAGALGAEIFGINLADPIGDHQFRELHEALMKYQVIFLRDQNILPEQHLAFARHFGTFEINLYGPHLEEHPEIAVLKSAKGSRYAANSWHTDVSYLEKPSLGAILLAREVPDYGGDTMWADMYAAYEDLSPAMKRYIEGMQAYHSAADINFSAIYTDGISAERKAELKNAQQASIDVLHPVVRTHPVTGRKALYVNSGITKRIKGVPRNESTAILEHLYRHLIKPEYTCRFRWQKHSMAIWDNRCTQHYAIADYGDATRIMHRVSIVGERPV